LFVYQKLSLPLPFQTKQINAGNGKHNKLSRWAEFQIPPNRRCCANSRLPPPPHFPTVTYGRGYILKTLSACDKKSCILVGLSCILYERSSILYERSCKKDERLCILYGRSCENDERLCYLYGRSCENDERLCYLYGRSCENDERSCYLYKKDEPSCDKLKI